MSNSAMTSLVILAVSLAALEARAVGPYQQTTYLCKFNGSISATRITTDVAKDDDEGVEADSLGKVERGTIDSSNNFTPTSTQVCAIGDLELKNSAITMVCPNRLGHSQSKDVIVSEVVTILKKSSIVQVYQLSGGLSEGETPAMPRQVSSGLKCDVLVPSHQIGPKDRIRPVGR
jgi:hypothetical protein